jgi:MFS superfamily sulfate permease-like transporter
MRLREYFSSDLPASVVVFLVALPLCLGIALASGVPLISGLIAGVIGGIVVGALSGSPVSVSGPAAGLVVVVLAGVNLLGYEAFLLSVVLAGLFQIVLGFLRAGYIGHFFPVSVLKGMLAAIGLILILKQIPHAFGYDADFEGDQSFFQFDGKNTFTEIAEAFEFLTPGAIVVSLISIVVLVVWNSERLQRINFFKMLPGPLFVVLIGAFLNIFFTYFIPDLAIAEKNLVSVPLLTEGNNIFSWITLPDFSKIMNRDVLITAATIGAVASIETLLNIEATDKLDPYRRITSPNRELKAQGVANMMSGLIGGLPVTSVVVRSSANIQAGARSKASAITHGVILLVAVLLLPSVLNQIPLASIAGILIVVGYKLTSPSIYKEMSRKGIEQFLPFAVTVFAVVFTNLLAGVFTGVLVAIFFILRTSFQESIILVNEGNSYLMKFTKDVSFVHKASLRNILRKIPSNSSIVIDGSQSLFVDQDVKETIEDFIKTSKAKNIHVELKKINTQ